MRLQRASTLEGRYAGSENNHESWDTRPLRKDQYDAWFHIKAPVAHLKTAYRLDPAWPPVPSRPSK